MYILIYVKIRRGRWVGVGWAGGWFGLVGVGGGGGRFLFLVKIPASPLITQGVNLCFDHRTRRPLSGQDMFKFLFKNLSKKKRKKKRAVMFDSFLSSVGHNTAR